MEIKMFNKVYEAGLKVTSKFKEIDRFEISLSTMDNIKTASIITVKIDGEVLPIHGCVADTALVALENLQKALESGVVFFEIKKVIDRKKRYSK
jgi:hypothetical protein